MAKIVVLDGYAANPGDLSWDELKKLGEVVVYDRTPLDKILERAAGAEILLTNKTPLQGETIFQLASVKYIGVLATGYNVVDTEAAHKKNIIVTNIPAYSTDSVTQIVFAFLLEFCHHVQRHSDTVYNGEWTNSEDFCYWKYPLVELAGKTLGIIGYGRIGQQVASVAEAFGMKVLAYSRSKREPSGRSNFRWAELDELLRESDVVTLHCPLFPETKGLINKETLGKMKSTAFLINTSRGPIVVEEDLAEALNSGRIAGAGVDVLSSEPPKADNPLLKAKNCFITPHISWATKEARTRLMTTAVENVKAFLAGSPINKV